MNFKRIIQGNYVEIYTDNKNCTYDSKKETSRILRRKLLLNEFNHCIYHIQREQNSIADNLSRCLIIGQNSKRTELNKLVHNACERKANGEMLVDRKKRIIIKPTEYVNFIKNIHVSSLHIGTNTMYYNLKKYFYIKNIYKIIKRVTETCNICSRIKIRSFKINKENKITADYKFKRISTDIYGSFKLNEYKLDSLREVGYIMSITDIYTRFTKLYFLETIDTKKVVGKLKQWIKEISKPKYIISDNGRQFRNTQMKKFLKLNNIKQILVPEYTPSSNGISERANKIITEALTINKGKTIKEVIEEAEHCLNNNYNRTIKASPGSKVNGFDFYNILNLPSEKDDKDNMPLHNTVCKRYKIGDKVYKRKFNSEKIGHKYELIIKRITQASKKVYWVKLDEEPGWTHIKNIKLVRRSSMW